MARRLFPWGLFAALAAAGVLAGACLEEGAPGAAKEAGAGAPAAAEEATTIAAAEEAAPVAPGTLAGGQHTVLGLRIPNGMQPVGSPSPGVYRFEGPQAPEIAARVVEAQLARFSPPVAEQGAVLYRRATVREPAGGAPPAILAIRVHLREKGCALDVWRETEGAAAPNAATPGQWAGPALDGEPPPPPKYATPEERRRAVFEMLGKVKRGEPLTERDYDNPLFQ